MCHLIKNKTTRYRAAGGLIGSISVFALLTIMPARAEPMNEITVFGTRLPTVLSETGTSISVITAEDIALKGYDFALDAVADVPGVSINQNGAFGGAAFVRIRGASGNGHTLVLLDGVAVNDPTSVGNAFDFASLDAQNIERIEVLKGALATLWGADAMAGVVSITTKASTERAFSGYMELGSFNSLQMGLALGGACGKASGRIFGNYHATDGISKADEDEGNSEDDGFENITLNAKGRVEISDALRIDASFFAATSKTEFDAFGPIDGEAIADNDQLVAALSAHYQANERVVHDVQLGYTQIERDNYGADAYAFGKEGKRWQLRYQSLIEMRDNSRIALGLDYEEIESEGVGIDDSAEISSLFGLYELSPTARLTVTLGARYGEHSIFKEDATGRASVVYDLFDTTSLSASFSQGRKAPTLDELQDTPSLKPEEATSFDVGMTYNGIEGVAFGLTYFQQDTENLLQYVGVWPCAVNCYANVDETETRGLEFITDMVMSDFLALSAHYTFTDAKTDMAAKLGRIPEHAANVTLSYQAEGVGSVNVILRYNGEELDMNGSTDKLDSWMRVDVNAAYNLSDAKQIYGRLGNLFDTDYQQVRGYGTPGLSAHIGLRFNL